ncbi:hypothetical protein [Rhizobium leguminosarum]|uniref:hypothetical protein n=1 Tax=Rhizobium leguminosarum TaxID=384 RepID=UPI001FEF3ED8|nr:hypothetical protein [Rhizobium leguminosarum]
MSRAGNGWRLHSNARTGSSISRIYPEDVELSAKDQAEYDALVDEHAYLVELVDNDAADENAAERLAKIDKRLDELSERKEVYQPDDMARSGVVVFLNHYGKAEAAIGIVRDDDEAKAGDDAEGTEVGDNEGAREDGEASAETITAKEGAPKFTHPAALIEDLTAQKTAALRVELANNTETALAAVVHAMLLRVAYPGYATEQSALQLSLTHERIEKSMKQPEKCTAVAAFENLQENYGYKIPGNPADLFDWCVKQDHEELLLLLAYAAAHSVNAVETKFSDRRNGIAQANQLGRALNVTMSDWFETTADSYFNHVNRRGIEQAVLEAQGPEAALSVSAAGKKAEAVLIAERRIKGVGWLPAPVRIAADPNAEAEAEAKPVPMAAE